MLIHLIQYHLLKKNPLCSFSAFASLSEVIWLYFEGLELCCALLTCLSLCFPTLYGPDRCSCVVSLEFRQCQFSNFRLSSYTTVCSGFAGFLLFVVLTVFRVSICSVIHFAFKIVLTLNVFLDNSFLKKDFFIFILCICMTYIYVSVPHSCSAHGRSEGGVRSSGTVMGVLSDGC